MGAVYLARSPELQRSEALKVLNRDLLADGAFRARFLREADVAAQLSHPCIMPVYRRGSTEDGLLWIAMLYVDGTDADSAVGEGSVSPHQAMYIGTEVGSALDYAHSRGVVHRDVKPANFLVSKPVSESDRERVFLGDFGLAHAIGQSQLGESGGAVLATVGYAAPEVLAGAEVDERADLYSLGCSLVRLVTGQRPFLGTIDEVIEGHLTGSVPRVSEMREGLPPALDAVIAKALAKDPDRRFRSAGELMAAATEALNFVARRPQGAVVAPVTHRSEPSPRPRPSRRDGLAGGPAANLGDFAPPVRRAPRAAGARLRTRAAVAGLGGHSREARLRRVGAVAAAVAVVVGGVLWWSGSSPDEADPTTAAPAPVVDTSSPSSSSSSMSSAVLSTASASKTAAPVRDSGADQRLLGAVPPGFPPGACQAVTPAGAASAMVQCAATGDPAVSASVTYEQMASRTAMLSRLFAQMDALTVVTCPGNIRSPGTWHRNATPDRTAGIVVCGMEHSTAVVAWTTDGQALFTAIRADEGTTLDQLYGWWSFHS